MNKKVIDKNTFVIFFLFISIFLMVGASQNKVDGRGMFVFGPNVLYRIFACSSLLLLLLGQAKAGVVKLCVVFLSLILFFIGLVITSSRGGLVLLPILLLAGFHLYYDKINLKTLFFVLAFPITFVVAIFYFVDLSGFNSRLLSLSVDGNIRFVPWRFFIENPLEVIGRFDYSQSFFIDYFSVTPGFLYPHNIILEFVYYYEIIGISFVAIMCVMFVISFIKMLRMRFSFRSLLYYIAAVLFIGGMFSGDLTDNFSCLALMLYLSTSSKHAKRKDIK